MPRSRLPPITVIGASRHPRSTHADLDRMRPIDSDDASTEAPSSRVPSNSGLPDAGKVGLASPGRMLRAARPRSRGRGSHSWSRGGAGSCSLILPGTIDLMLEVVEQPDQVLDLPIPFLGRAPEEVDHFLDRPMQRIGVTDEDHVPARACQGGALFPADPRGGEDQPGARSGDNSIPGSLAGSARPLGWE